MEKHHSPLYIIRSNKSLYELKKKTIHCCLYILAKNLSNFVHVNTLTLYVKKKKKKKTCLFLMEGMQRDLETDDA